MSANRSEVLKQVTLVDFSIADAIKSDVYFYLFKSDSQSAGILIEEGWSLPHQDAVHPLKVLIHGYTSNVTSPWYKDLKNAYFRQGPHNIIYVDWCLAGNKYYLVSAANIDRVGGFIADCLVNLKVPLENIHLIGHSLGAHLAGFVGKHVYLMTEKKVGRITGSDPAGPSFNNALEGSRLNKFDGTFVDVIHTDMAYFGGSTPMGHVDFYANGGKHQPGCGPHKVDDNCHHLRSIEYFIESVNVRNVTAIPAKFNEREDIIPQPHSTEIVFGDAVPHTVRGIYYLKTNHSTPFLIPKGKPTSYLIAHRT